MAKATFVPGRIFRWMSAYFVSPMSRGSTTIRRVPFITAFRICMPTTGWASSGFEPISRMQSTPWVISWIGLVIAPEPSVFARPATVAEWHTRAQLSVLFVPKQVRTIFCTM